MPDLVLEQGSMFLAGSSSFTSEPATLPCPTTLSWYPSRVTHFCIYFPFFSQSSAMLGEVKIHRFNIFTSVDVCGKEHDS